MRWQTGEVRHAVFWLADNADLPATGLTPTVQVRRVSDGTIVNPAPAVAEVGEGFYRLSFTAPAAGSFVFLVDAGVALDAAHRYVPLEVPVGGYVDNLDRAVTALGDPAQALGLAAVDLELDEIRAALVALGSPAQAAALTALRTVADEIRARTDVATSSRARPEDVQITVQSEPQVGVR